MLTCTKTILLRISYYNQNTFDAKKAKSSELHLEYLPHPTQDSFYMRIHTDRDDGKFIDVDPRWLEEACKKIQAMEKL